jgi:hypothetical protein
MSANGKSDEQVLKEAIHILGEHFTTVQVFVTKTQDGGTQIKSSGEGDFCSRYGFVKEWVFIQEEKFRIKARKLFEAEE